MSESAPVDTYYYDLLEVPPTATESEIKKGYVKMARKWHPDKNPENPNAEAQFKEVNEAYQILKDVDKRKRYDKFGRDKLKEQEQGGISDPRDLFRGLFGGGKFDHVFGDVGGFSMFMAMSEEPTPEGTPPEMSDEVREAKLREMEAKQAETIRELAESLRHKLKSWLLGNLAEFETAARNEATDMADFPGGGALLVHIGYLYEQEGKQHIGRFFGLQGFFCEVREKAHILKETFSLISSVAKVQAAEQRIQKEGENDELSVRMASEGLSAIWKIGKLEIESIVRRVCEAVLQDLDVDKGTRTRRAEGVERLGEIYSQIGLDALKREKDEMERRKQEYEAHMKSTTTTSSSTEPPKQ